MLLPNPIKRPSLSEIQQHDWFQAYIPTKDEVKEDFMLRLKQYDNVSQNSSLETTDDFDINPDELLLNNTHRGIVSDDEEADTGITIREAQVYNHRTKKLTQFFSTSDVEVLFRNLAFYIDENASKFKFEKSNYGSRFKVLREKEGEIDISINIFKVASIDN